MYTIKKITSSPVVDFAAEELKKYLRMMMPDAGEIIIKYAPEARDGFRLGLMQDFGLDVSDAEDPELDDILYIDCDERGGIIAGDNPRSVLLSVYEYLRRNGCRWLMPGVDGEFIPMQNIKPVKYRFVPSCRYRGQCNEGAESQQAMLETIDWAPKVGMNVYMLEFDIPTVYYDWYYQHRHNTANREPEPVNADTVLQWKRACEAEIAKSGVDRAESVNDERTRRNGCTHRNYRAGEILTCQSLGEESYKRRPKERHRRAVCKPEKFHSRKARKGRSYPFQPDKLPKKIRFNNEEFVFKSNSYYNEKEGAQRTLFYITNFSVYR